MIETATMRDHAAALVSIGMKIFPCREQDEVYPSGKVMPVKSPRTLNGLYDATDSLEQVDKWWAMWPNSTVGVAAGASGIVVLDGDIKNSKDFETSLFAAGLTPPDTWEYTTPSGGRHFIFEAPEGVPLNGQANYRGLQGVDRRGGSSYVIFHGPVPYDRSEFKPAPDWLCDAVEESSGTSAYSGDVDEWLGEHFGVASPLLRHIQEEDFAHSDDQEFEHDRILKLIIRIVALGAQGEYGATSVLEALRERYLSDGYEDYEGEWRGMLTWAVANVGGAPEVTSPTPGLYELMDLLPEEFDATLLTTEVPIGELLSALKAADLPDEDIHRLARASKSGGPIPDDELLAEIYTTELPKPKPEKKKPDVSRRPKPVKILSAADRKAAKQHWNDTWLGEYERWLQSSILIYNAPYHRPAAWQILASAFSGCAYILKGKRRVPLNMWTWTVGPSTTGKSEAKDAMQKVIHKMLPGEMNPDIGADTSTGALLEKLHLRNGEPVLLNSDEADGLILEATQNGSWKTGQIEKWTDLYDGRVPPQIRRGDVEGQWSDCVFNMYMVGTEAGVADALTPAMFQKGFLVRMCWFVGDDLKPDKSLLGYREGTSDDWESDEEQIETWGRRFGTIREQWTFRKNISPRASVITMDSDETRDFYHRISSDMAVSVFADSPNYEILKPSLVRMMTAIVKMAALVAISDNRQVIAKKDLLVAILQAEEMLGNAEYMASKIADNDHSKMLDTVWVAVARRGIANSQDVYIEMARHGLTKRDVDGLIEGLKAQGRIIVTPRNGQPTLFEALQKEEK